MKSALIIGGNRFVGRRLVHLLKSKNIHVTQLNRSGTGEADVLLRANRMNPPELEATLGTKTWDIAYDFACFHPEDALQSARILGTRVARICAISSQSVYGPGADLKEKDFDPYSHPHFDPSDRTLDYAEAKRQMEMGYLREARVPTQLVRFPILLGLDDYTKRLHFHVERIRKGQEIHLPNPDARLCFANSSEAADFLEHLAHCNVQGPINFCSSHAFKLTELLSLIETAVKQKVRLTKTSGTDADSPFGVESDWVMNTDLAKANGFQPSVTSTWLPDLVLKLAAN